MTITKKIVNRLYYTIDKWTPPVTIKADGPKKALLSYILHPFRKKGQLLHCNIIESLQMVEALKELDYAVDVVDYRYRRAIDYGKYDLVVGLGAPLRQSFDTNKKTLKRVCYLTGANPNFSNLAEARRLKAIYERKSMLLKARREVYWPWVFSAVNADGIILTGNEWTASTFYGVNDNLHTVPVPYISSDDSMSSNVSNKKGFVWFSGYGAIHKGLDLALEAVCDNINDFTLDVCGNILKEKDFVSCYNKELFNHPRVKFFGMIDPNGPYMKDISTRNAFVIFPSCSEGTASSVITCMAQGLIPVVTKESGISLNGFGIEINDATPRGVLEAMHKAAQMTEDEIKRQKNAVNAFVRQNHSAQSYKDAFATAINNILSRSETDRMQKMYLDQQIEKI